MILRRLQFILFWVRKMVLYQIVVRTSKYYVNDMEHFIDEENIVTYVDFECGIAFYPETPTKIRQINWDRNYISRSCKKPKCIPARINITVLLMSSIAVISFWARTISGTWFQQLVCHSTTLMIDTLCPIITLRKELTNLEQTLIQCSFHCERWTVKGRNCASALHSFKEITHRTDEWTKQLPPLMNWVISGNPEQWMEFRRLWWSLIVFKCSFLFHLFHFFCLLGQ